MYEEELKIKLTDLMELNFIELPKFLKQQKDLEDSLQRWLLFLIKPNKEIFEEIEMKDPTIKKAKTILEFLERDAETVRLAELREKAIRDEISRIEGAREEGRDEGREEGKIEVAKKLLKMGMDILTVINATELKKEEIEKIKSSMN
ncbi:PD-(D/E)XK nuclease family transposase [Clostridium magnum DSM 2767]|uniref:PD-(D/E)XK nuclease family transposase n=1 Tax=Clostridium magnum DSM 2767 TaxID=1121326 RepID=A0A162RDB2_9CLOT|nr:PD-(D/E)XK nuclease family transposase [Clostridium magnum DSM 2767]